MTSDQLTVLLFSSTRLPETYDLRLDLFRWPLTSKSCLYCICGQPPVVVDRYRRRQHKNVFKMWGFDFPSRPPWRVKILRQGGMSRKNGFTVKPFCRVLDKTLLVFFSMQVLKNVLYCWMVSFYVSDAIIDDVRYLLSNPINMVFWEWMNDLTRQTTLKVL